MLRYLLGFVSAALIASISLNIAQYSGVLSSPQMVMMQPTDEQVLASVLGGEQ